MLKKYGIEHPRFVVIDEIYESPDGKWNRKCSCGKTLSYSQRSSCIRQFRAGSLCASCAASNRLLSHNHPLHGVKGERHPNFGKRRSEKTKQKLSILHKGKEKSEAHKEKLRIAAVERVEKLGRKRGFNLKACSFMDDFGVKHGYSFRHAINGGEIVISGYCLDGFDATKKVVFEYDESHHETQKQKLKDITRTKRLINNFGLEIIRYSEKYGRTYRSTPLYSEILS
jgi:hypothetical protein